MSLQSSTCVAATAQTLSMASWASSSRFSSISLSSAKPRHFSLKRCTLRPIRSVFISRPRPTVTVKRLRFTRVFSSAEKEDATATATGNPGISSSKRQQQKPEQDPELLQVVSLESEDASVEGVIRLDKESAEKPGILPRNWRGVLVLGIGDGLSLLAFSAISRANQGLPVLCWDAVGSTDNLFAGWVLGAFFLDGFKEDALGGNGKGKGLVAATKSWAVGIPLGLIIEGLKFGFFPAVSNVLISMAGTLILLVGWRFIFSVISPVFRKSTDQSSQYKSGSPFEFLELLFSLVRRW